MKPTANRNLYNADCNTYFYKYKGPHAWQKTDARGRYSPKSIHNYVDLLARSGVDTFVYNPNASRAFWPSKTIPTAWDGYKRGDRKHIFAHVIGQAMTQDQIEIYMDSITGLMDRYLDLVEAGCDLLAETSKACRRNKISPWVSARMNDMHGANSLEHSFMNSPLLARPELRLKGVDYCEKHKPVRAKMALNYVKREVRDYMLTMIREMIEDYDFDALELDWTRHTYCCDPVASQKTIDTVTDWHAEIAALCHKKAKSTGRPYYMGIRAPANFNDLRHIGLDVVAIAKAGLIDFVCPTREGWSTTWDLPHDTMQTLLGDQVAIYGVVEDAPNWLPAYAPKPKFRHYIRYSSASKAMLRGNAAGKLVLGADGIETFNFFCTDNYDSDAGLSIQPDYSALRGLHDLKTLRGKRKFYSFSCGFEHWGTRTILQADEFLPLLMEPTTQRRFRLPMCAEPAGMELTIQIVLERPPGTAPTPAPGTTGATGGTGETGGAGNKPLPDIGVSFNDSWPSFDSTPTDALLEPSGSLTHHVPEHTALNFRFPASAIREGWNELVVAHGAEDPGEPAKRREQAIKVVAIELLVDRAGKRVRRAKR